MVRCGNHIVPSSMLSNVGVAFQGELAGEADISGTCRGGRSRNKSSSTGDDPRFMLWVQTGFSSVWTASSIFLAFGGRPRPRFGRGFSSAGRILRGLPGPRFGGAWAPSGKGSGSGCFRGLPGPRFGGGWASCGKGAGRGYFRGLPGPRLVGPSELDDGWLVTEDETDLTLGELLALVLVPVLVPVSVPEPL
jgi:hypothetical protein